MYEWYREGRPSTAVVPANFNAVREMIEAYRHVTYREIEACLRIDQSQIGLILRERLVAKKLCNRWIPHNVTKAQEMARIHSKFLSIHDEKLEPIKTQNSLVTIFAIWNTIMGSSLLAMAWGFQKSGLIPGMFLHAFIAGICLYTAQTILKISDSQGSYGNGGDVPELCKALLGKWAEILAKIFSLIVLIGANIVYWILMSNFLYNSVDFIYGYIVAPDEIDNRTVICPKEEFNRTGMVSLTSAIKPSNFYAVWNLYTTVPLFLAVLMFPFLNFKSPTFFTKFNSLGAASVCYMIAFVIVKASNWGIQEINWLEELHIKPTFQALSGMLALSYFIHNIIVSVMRSNRQQQHNVRDLSIAYCLVLFTYVFVGTIFYVSFPLSKSCIE
ncbi:Amino acid transporter, partial [Oryctes borbonicus]